MQHPVPEHKTAAIADPGLIIRLSQSLGSQTDVIQFEGFIDRDSQQSEIDALCDKMVKAGARQRALHQLPDLRRSLENVEYKHNENRKRLAELNAREKAQNDIRGEKLDELHIKESQFLHKAADEHRASGRRAEFSPAKHAGGDVGRIRSEIAEIERGAVNERNEATIQRSTLDNELKEGERAIMQLRALIAETEAVSNG